MKILFCAGECHPFFKTGGLADVAYALPRALADEGHDVRVILPLYKSLKGNYREKLTHTADFTVDVSYRRQYCGIEELKIDNVTYYFVDNMYYFDRDNLYGYIDDGERFSFFSSAIIESLEKIGFIPDVIHVNDWHTAIVPLLLKVKYHWIGALKDIRTVLTIHNLKFQGIFPFEVLGDLLGIGDSVMTDEGVEYFGAVNFMKGGINYSDFVTTVSPTYAEEIKTPDYGEKLDGLMRRISYKLKGIVNGIDTQHFNPETDEIIPFDYSASDLKGKKKDRALLIREAGMTDDGEPVLALISRLTSQKGLDILTYGLEALLDKKVKLLIVGTGDKEYEDSFKYFEWKYPEQVKFWNLFDADLAQRLYAGADMILVPSLFEPCGLTQMIGMRYGTVPIVRETGGLKDTVIPWNKFTGEGTGFTFSFYNHMDLLGAVDRALECYHEGKSWKKVMENGMKKDFGWKKSAAEYEDIYEKITDGV